MIIINSYFCNNNRVNTNYIKYKSGNPCINHRGNSNLSIYNSIFRGNKADYESNCLFFIGV